MSGTTNSANRILIVEDDKDIAELERDYLEASGFVTKIAGDGPTGLSLALSGSYDLVLLDLMLPGMDGRSVCRTLREQSNIPVIMVTARGEDIDVIRGLGIGADDYVTKPFSPSVLVARVKACLARAQRAEHAKGERPSEAAAGATAQTAQALSPHVLAFGDVRINLASHEVRVADAPVALTNREYELLLFLARRPNTVFSRDALYERVWGQDAIGDGATVTVHINRLREKIEHDPAHPVYLQTVRGAGYILRTDTGKR